jgi:2-polyprenyl-3-methyl-5-hydroxy-6-metoxy-1,4-benzoquinol methylase
MSRVVKEYYNTKAEHEWNRLVQDAYHQLEYIVHTHFLEKHLPKKGLILDAGGGPGRYTIELAKKGYQVVLLDLSPRCLEIAKREIKNAKVEDRVKKIVEGSIANLSEFRDESFDAVLCLGTLSHVIDKEEREEAARELVRVAKNKASIFVSVINRYGVFRTILQRLPYELTDPAHQETFSEGVHHAHYRHPLEPEGGFTDAYFFLPHELRELFEKNGVQTLDMATCEGLSSHLQEATNAIYNDPAKWERWLEILLKSCTDPSILGIGEHLLYVGKKRI